MVTPIAITSTRASRALYPSPLPHGVAYQRQHFHCLFQPYQSPQTPASAALFQTPPKGKKRQQPQKLDFGELVSHIDSTTDIHGLTGEIK